MDENIYSLMIEIKKELQFSSYYLSTDKEEIKEFLLECGFEDSTLLNDTLYHIVERNKREIDGNFNYVQDTFKKTFSKMEPDEIRKMLEKLNEKGALDEHVIDSVPDLNYILEMFDQIDDMLQYAVLNRLPDEEILAYIENNGKGSLYIEEYFARTGNSNLIEWLLNNLTSERKKAEVVLLKNNVIYLPFIEEEYYRGQIIKNEASQYHMNTYDLIAQMDEYDKYKEEIDGIEDEDKKAEYISKINDNQMKDVFLSRINKKENKDKIINSYDRYVDDDIKEMDALAQKMIREYFEDVLGEKLSDEQREKLDLIMKSANVYFADIEENVNGKAILWLRDIQISTRHKNNKNIILGTLIHEYAHLLSNDKYLLSGFNQTFSIDEGMADLLGDLAVNHYLEKHKEVLLDGRPIRVSNPYKTYSGYNFEAAWPRTMLAGLEAIGKDKDAIREYYLGSKYKFAEMIFGEESANDRKMDEYDLMNLDTTYEEMFSLIESVGFDNINRDSIFCDRNYILPAFELHYKLKDKLDLMGTYNNGGYYGANDIMKEYFDGKKFYEVPKEELEEFVGLINKQLIPKLDRTSPIVDVYGYPIIEISGIKTDDVKDYSFEILDKMPILFGNTKEIVNDIVIEKAIELALEREKEKIRNGQPWEETKRKKEALVERYRKLFPKEDPANIFINDFISDFEFECEQQEKSNKSPDKDYE